VILWSVTRRKREEKIEKRLGLHELQEEEKVLSLWLEDRVATTTVLKGRRKSLSERFEELRTAAGWEIPASSILATLASVVFFSLGGSYLFTKSLLPGAGVAAAIVLAFWFYLNHAIGKRVAVFERQFVDALDLAARSLRAGHPLLGAFRLISEEIAAPVSTVFGEVCQQQALGVSLDHALKNVAAKSWSSDMKLFATAVIIQLRSGGNLAQMMDRLAFVIRDRMRLSRRVRVLTAQTQFSKRVLISLPLVLFFLLNVLNPEYMRALYQTAAGRTTLTIGTVGLLLGIWVMNRMAVLKY
jgi:tight adherence protein B